MTGTPEGRIGLIIVDGSEDWFAALWVGDNDDDVVDDDDADDVVDDDCGGGGDDDVGDDDIDDDNAVAADDVDNDVDDAEVFDGDTSGLGVIVNTQLGSSDGDVHGKQMFGEK